MSRVLLVYSTIIIIFGRLSITRAECREPSCSKGDQNELSSMTVNTLTAAELQFNYERESSLPPYLNKHPGYLSYKIIDKTILKKLEETGLSKLQNRHHEFFYNAYSILRDIDRSKKVLTSGKMEVHLTQEGVKALNWKLKTKEVAKKSYCVVNLGLLNYLHPLMSDSSGQKLVYPNEDGNILFGLGETVLFSCHRNRFELFNDENMTWECFGGSIFRIGSIHMDIRQIKCRPWQRLSYSNCGEGNFNDMDGYERTYTCVTPLNYESNKYDIIYNKYDQNEIYYTRTTVSKTIKGGQKIDENKRMKDMEKYLNEIQRNLIHYESEKQELTLQLQLQGTVNDFCIMVNPLVATHLASPISMVYESLAMNTFNSLNYSPQWKSIFENNWDTINHHVNKMASYMQKDLTVITGIHRDLKIRNKYDDSVKSLYLNYLISDMGYVNEIPIKLYFFKIVIEPGQKKGVVFVTVNNPYFINFPLYEICEEPRFPRLQTKTGCSWDPKYVHYGYSYTCKLDDFFKNSGYPLRDEITKNLDMLPVELEYEIEVK